MATKQSEYVDKSRKLAQIKKLIEPHGGTIEHVVLVRLKGQTQIRHWTGSEWEKVVL